MSNWTPDRKIIAAFVVGAVVVPFVLWGFAVFGVDLPLEPLHMLYGACIAVVTGYFTKGDAPQPPSRDDPPRRRVDDI